MNYWYSQQSIWWANNHSFYRHNINDITMDLVEAGTNTPVTLDQMKAQLNIVDSDADDEYLADLIMSATAWSERYTGRSIFGSTWDQFQNKFDHKNKLHYPKLDEITFVKYYDSTGTQITLDNTQYSVQALSESRGVLWFDQFKQRPHVQHDNPFGVQIRYTTIPFTSPDLCHAIKLVASEWFLQRANTSEVMLAPISVAAKNLLDPLCVGGYL